MITLRCKKHWLWRAIDADGNVLDILVQTRRNAKAAKHCLEGLTASFGEPRVVITDKLRSYIKPIKTLTQDADHRAHKGLNNAIEVFIGLVVHSAGIQDREGAPGVLATIAERYPMLRHVFADVGSAGPKL